MRLRYDALCVMMNGVLCEAARGVRDMCSRVGQGWGDSRAGVGVWSRGRGIK
jgi:hypothetical protein